MKTSEIKNLLKSESEKVDIKMSENLINTPILAAENKIPIKKSNKTLFALIPSLAAAFMIAIIFAFSFFGNNGVISTAKLTAYVIEINPSIAITTDENDKVINICSLNGDADDILSSEEFSEIVGKDFNLAVNKIISVANEKGVLDNYEQSIKIYAVCDSENLIPKKLDGFENLVKENLRGVGKDDIGIEKNKMAIDDFKGKMGFTGEEKRLDDMRNDIERHDRLQGDNPPPKPDGEPQGDNPPPKPDGEQQGDNPPPKPDGETPPKQ